MQATVRRVDRFSADGASDRDLRQSNRFHGLSATDVPLSTITHSAVAFSEARDRQAVLLIDEADTFLAPRAAAARTYEVSQVNEFLKQMEQHTGILVCCTNLLDRLDFCGDASIHLEGHLPLARRHCSS